MPKKELIHKVSTLPDNAVFFHHADEGLYRYRLYSPTPGTKAVPGIECTLLILVETLLIVFLMAQRGKRLAAEKALKEHRDAQELAVQKRTKELNENP